MNDFRLLHVGHKVGRALLSSGLPDDGWSPRCGKMTVGDAIVTTVGRIIPYPSPFTEAALPFEACIRCQRIAWDDWKNKITLENA